MEFAALSTNSTINCTSWYEAKGVGALCSEFPFNALSAQAHVGSWVFEVVISATYASCPGPPDLGLAPMHIPAPSASWFYVPASDPTVGRLCLHFRSAGPHRPGASHQLIPPKSKCLHVIRICAASEPAPSRLQHHSGEKCGESH